MDRHKNNVGLLRLTLASAVIFGHAAEQIDGSRVHEPLTEIFHTLSLGGLAVDGFFALSGYLICNSMLQSRSALEFLKRRCLRIVPAYVVAYLLCTVFLAPMVGGKVTSWARVLVYMLGLHAPPDIPGTFSGLAYTGLNGSMWTIAYEFRCYLLVLLLGVLGLLKNRRFIAIATLGLLIGCLISSFPQFNFVSPDVDAKMPGKFLLGEPSETLSLTAIFMVGVTFCVWWREIDIYLTPLGAALCGLGLLAALFSPILASVGVMTLGAYGLFWLGFKANLGWLQKINDQWDISYGVYLYGWPVASTLLWWHRGFEPLPLALVSLLISVLLGACSWVGVERWTKDLGKRRNVSKSVAPAANTVKVG